MFFKNVIKIQPKLNNYYFPNINFKANPYSEAQLEEQNNIDSSLWQLPAKELGAISVLPSSTVQRIAPECFFIRMEGYGKDYDWARKMVNLVYNVSYRMNLQESFEDILRHICETIPEINHDDNYGRLNDNMLNDIIICAKHGRGKEYVARYADKLNEPDGDFSPKSNAKYEKANTAKVSRYKDKDYILIEYGCNRRNGNVNLALCKQAYDELISNENPTAKDVFETCATIQWLIAQEYPFYKGNDSIANLLTRGIMHCYGLKISPVKEGCSLDFEAFCTDLDEYIKKYPTFFEKYPSKI